MTWGSHSLNFLLVLLPCAPQPCMCLIPDIPFPQPYNREELPSAALPAARQRSPSFKGNWGVYYIVPFMLQRFQMLIKCFLIVPGTRMINSFILFQSRKQMQKKVSSFMLLASLCFHKRSHRTLQNQESLFHLTVSCTLKSCLHYIAYF